MWQKSIIFGAVLAGVVFLIGVVQNLATTRMLVIRSLLTAAGSILAVIVAQKAIKTFTSSRQSVEAPLNDLNLGEFVEEETTSSETSEPETTTSESDSQEDVDVDNDDLQDALEEEVEKGNEEGVEEIADLISDSMDEE